MKKLPVFAATLLAACAPTSITPRNATAQVGAPVEGYDALDSRIMELMAANDVKGMAIAVIDRDEIRHVLERQRCELLSRLVRET